MSDRDTEFTAFVAGRRRTLLRTAYLLCGSWTQAEDVLQIALAKVYVAWPRVDRRRGPEAYVRTTIARTAIDEHRRPWRREVADDELLDRTPDRERLDPADGIALRRALAALPGRQRQVVVLRYFAGLSVAETAADLGITEGAVKSHTSRGLSRLESLLREPIDEPIEVEGHR